MATVKKTGGKGSKVRLKDARVPLIPKPLGMYPLGRVEGEPIEVYHRTPAVSASKLRLFAPPKGRPATFYKEFVDGGYRVTEKETDAMRVGHATHTLVLEGLQAYESRYLVAPWLGKPGDWGAEVRFNAWKAKHPGAAVLSAQDDAKNRRLARAVWAHEDAAALLCEGMAEVTWRLGTEHYFLQARTDRFIDHASAALAARFKGMREGDAIIVEFKTCGTLGYEGFGSFPKYFEEDYLEQVALYHEIVTAIHPERVPWIFFIAAEKEDPHEAGVFAVDPDDLVTAKRKVAATLQLLDACVQSGQWPGAGTGVRTLRARDWYAYRAQDHIEAAERMSRELRPIS